MININNDLINKPAIFIIPHFSDINKKTSRNFLKHTIEGLFNQSDQNWNAIIVDDCSNDQDVKDYLLNLKEEFFPKIDVVFLNKNYGPGVCRNIAIKMAYERGAYFLLFNDADDISHPDRLKITRELFDKNKNADLIYSPFKVIDENNNNVNNDKIPSQISKIMNLYDGEKLEGEDVWIDMGIKTGYFNKTSCTSVKVDFAYFCPFPNEYASEDFHTWMRLSASGAKFKYTDLVPTSYRVPTYLKYQNSREMIGPHNFNKIKVRMDSDGFNTAIELALLNRSIDPTSINDLKFKFYNRLMLSMQEEGETKLAAHLLDLMNLYKDVDNLYKGKII